MSFSSRTPDGMDMPPNMTTLNDENVATPVEEGKVAEVRQKLLGRAMTSGLVPAAVANGMLLVAINMDIEKDCDFGLTYYLMVTGILSLSLLIHNVICKIFVMRMISDNVVAVHEKKVVLALRTLGNLLLLLEGLSLSGGLFYICWIASSGWQYKKPEKKNYCVFGEVVFTAIFVGMANLFIGLGIAARRFICHQSKQVQKEVERRNADARKPFYYTLEK